jgi:hypothetical protein
LNRREVQLFLAGQALSLIYTPPQATFREKSGLVSPRRVPVRRAVPRSGVLSASEAPSELFSQNWNVAVRHVFTKTSPRAHWGSGLADQIATTIQRHIHPAADLWVPCDSADAHVEPARLS